MTEQAPRSLHDRVLDLAWDLAKDFAKFFLVAVFSGCIWFGRTLVRLTWFDLPLRQRPWFLASLVYVLTAGVVLLTAWLWGIGPLAGLRQVYQKNRRRFLVRLLFSIAIPIPFAVSLAFLVSPLQVEDDAAKKVFPQASDLGPVFFRTFATNGEVSYEFIDETPVNGPHGYAKIRLKANDDLLRDNAGWVLYFIRGADISDQKQLRFFIRGDSGSEHIGIKMKDAQGVEVSVMLGGQYLLQGQGQITTTWQEASIPLSHFGNVNFKVMDSLTLFTDGSIAATVPQIIYVGGFSLLKSDKVAQRKPAFATPRLVSQANAIAHY